MKWVSATTVSDYEAVSLSPEESLAILEGIDDPLIRFRRATCAMRLTTGATPGVRSAGMSLNFTVRSRRPIGRVNDRRCFFIVSPSNDTRLWCCCGPSVICGESGSKAKLIPV